METLLTHPMEREPSAYEKIVTHNDFDGLVSAALCAWALKVDRIRFAGPLTITKSQMTITEKDVVCDLPYPLECGLWFDHHEGNLQDLELRKTSRISSLCLVAFSPFSEIRALKKFVLMEGPFLKLNFNFILTRFA